MADPAVPGGVVPPLVTPLTPDGRVDGESLVRLVRHVLDAGAAGVLVLGSTGEGGHLLPEEQATVVGVAADASGGRPVMAGVPAMNTRHARALGGQLAAAGAGCLLVPPPLALDLSQEELAAHYRTVASGVPVVAYHVPSRVPTPVGAELVGRLAAEGVLAGVKDSSGDLAGHRTTTLATEGVPGFVRLTGSETAIDAALLMGFGGTVAGLGNVWPERHAALVRAARDGDWAAARARQEDLTRLTALYDGPRGTAGGTATALGALKEALVRRGVIASATLTAPFGAPGPELRDHVRTVLAAADEE